MLTVVCTTQHVGMSKLVINHLEKVFITSDAATIVGELEVEHPAAKMLTMAAKQQETEVGDGTNFVVTFAGEVLKACRDLLRMGVHPSDVVLGIKTATEKAMSLLDCTLQPKCLSCDDDDSIP